MKIGRSFYIRIAAIVLVILLGVLMFFIGKQHTILLDNNKFEDIKALDEVTVAIDGIEGLPIYSRMRDQSIVTGQRHTIAVTYVDSNWEEHTFERDIKIPVGENMMILYLPYLVANPDAPQEEWLKHFESQAIVAEDPSADEVVLDDSASLMAF